MTEIGFAPKEVIPPQRCRLKILAADKAEAYGLQIGQKLRIVDGEHDGYTFTDYANRDEDTGQIKQGSKAWSIFEACLGKDFYKHPGVSLNSLVGKQFVAQVTQTRTGSRNKVEFGTVGPVPPEEKNQALQADEDGEDDEEEMFNDLPS
jgi:hypothetical protein